MDMAQARLYLETLPGVEVVEASGDAFFYDPTQDDPVDQRLPFATLVTNDEYDGASDLERRGLYRLNIGVSRETYEAHLGPPPTGPITAEPVDTGHDYRAIDVLMPHPIYASMGWVSVVSPSDGTFEAMRPLLTEAHGLAAERYARRRRQS